MTQQEEWRPVPGLPGYYASSAGRIASIRTGTWRILAGCISGSGYRYVKVIQDGQKRDRTAHSMVAEAFHGARPDGHEVRHLDGTRTNNAPANLRWGTPSENRYDSVRHGTHPMVARRNRGAAA